MDLTHLADLGASIGGVAVLATLAYLAVQVRQGARAIEVKGLRLQTTGPGYALFWQEARGAHAPSFQEYVDREVIPE